ncbi:PQQ-binding-like beta-propeller repeat protein [Streptomyces sp. ISL-10]|uniref:serine/threonine-protein kinase n=1 Tax=Streptomyces sp. ISL-10 TaxID=2819172 RepID=UPI001BEBC799|nr:serine/threonine-protein kinase [Streptomyces sp. ISL-10]MBT2368997.1 PQQ-binding-like beta-propeller repeat protein [Streptomyces sp. ISL-10]
MPPLRESGTGPEAELPLYAGQYRLEACLGAGGMGVVHLARSASGLRLAVKVVHQQYAADPEFRARFRQEVAAARRVSGAFTASVVDADPDDDRPWMATLYVPGPTLAEQVKRNGPLAPAELRRLTAGLAEALRDIHRAGVVHRDLKPSNVLLTDSGPKVIDFGISRPFDSDLRTETGKLIGSPPFMAPEQFQRPREVGPAADVFALGSVLVHAATGRGPFDSGSPYIVAYQVVHDEPDLTGVPLELAPLVGRCLAKDPLERPTPDEIMAALRPPSYEATAFIPAQRRAAGGEPSAASGPDTTTHVSSRPYARTRPRTTAKRNRLVAAGAALLVLLGGGALALEGRDTPERPGTTARAAETGAFAPWQTTLRTTEGSLPACAYADGALYCSAQGAGTARIDPDDGRLVWQAAVPEGMAAADPGSGPAVPGGLVHTAWTTTRAAQIRTYGTADGAPGWRADVSAYQTGFGQAGDTVLLVPPAGPVKALDAATGDQRWRRAVPGHSRPDFGPYNEETGLLHLFEGSADGRTTLITAVRPRSGEVAWQRRLAGNLTPAATVGSTLFLTSTDANTQTDAVVRYDPRRGSTHRVRLPFPLSEPKAAVRGDTVHLLSRGGTLLAVDTRPTTVAADAELWRLETGAGRTSAPVAAGRDRVYFSSADGRLFAVDTAEGRVLGQTRPRLRGGKLGFAATLPAPVIAPGKVFATAPDGSVFAVDAKDPARW